MSLPLDFLPTAAEEIERAVVWYELRSPGLGSRFLRALESVLSRAAESPKAFPVVARRTRKAVLRRFPFIVYFVVEDGRLLVTALFHGRRDSERWSDRVRESQAGYAAVEAETVGV